MKKNFPSKFKQPTLTKEYVDAQSVAIKQQGKDLREEIVNRISLPHADVSMPPMSPQEAEAEKQAIFEASNKPDLEAIGRAARAKELQAGAMLGAGIYNPADMPPYPTLLPPTWQAPYREPRWLTTGEAAKHIKVSPTKFIKLRADGMKFYKLKDDTILYNVHDLNDWVMLQVAAVKS